MKRQVVLNALGLFLGAAALVAGDRAAEQGQAPQGPKKLTIETIPHGTIMAAVPTSWEEFAARADAIVRISFIAYASVNFPLTLDNRTVPLWYTRYEGTVKEAIKDSVPHPIPYMLSVYRRGGIFDTPKGWVKQVEQDFPDWIMGDDYVVVLTWAKAPVEGYVPLYSADGTFRLHGNGTVDAPGKSRFSRAQHGKPVQAFVNEVRQGAKGKGKD